MKILLIQQKMIGDVLTSSLLCDYLKQWNPNTMIHFVANQHTLPVLENNPNIDEIIVFGDHFQKDKSAFYRFLKERQKTHYDIVIDLYGKIESQLISLFTPAKQKISYHKWYSSWIYTNTIKRNDKNPSQYPLTLHHRNQLIMPLVEDNFIFDKEPKLYLTAKETEQARLLVQHRNPNKKLFMVSVLGSSTSKTYPLDQLAKMLDYLCLKYSVEIVFNYMPKQQDQINRLLDFLDPKTKKQLLLPSAPNSLREFICLLSQCDAIVGNEGGAINMGKALKKPSFAIFSPQIKKEGWHKDNHNNFAVHLSDYKMNYRFQSIHEKNIQQLYNEFKFNLFKEEFACFLDNVL